MDIAFNSVGIVNFNEKIALKFGWSTHGITFLASVGSNCVLNSTSFLLFELYELKYKPFKSFDTFPV